MARRGENNPVHVVLLIMLVGGLYVATGRSPIEHPGDFVLLIIVAMLLLVFWRIFFDMP